jgi:hypothetical protein
LEKRERNFFIHTLKTTKYYKYRSENVARGEGLQKYYRKFMRKMVNEIDGELIICPLQSTAGHRPISPMSRHLARSSATRIQFLPAALRKSSLHLA